MMATPVVNFGSRGASNVTFTVVERVKKSLILDCNFSDVHMEAILLQQRLVELPDRIAVHTFQGSVERLNDLIFRPERPKIFFP